MELTFDGAIEVELLRAARKALERLRYMADCAPMRRKLKPLVRSLEIAQTADAERAKEKRSRKERQAALLKGSMGSKQGGPGLGLECGPRARRVASTARAPVDVTPTPRSSRARRTAIGTSVFTHAFHW